jgi:hypothetical protein
MLTIPTHKTGRRTDPLNFTLRAILSNVAMLNRWPEGSRGHSYTTSWLMDKSMEVFNV